MVKKDKQMINTKKTKEALCGDNVQFTNSVAVNGPTHIKYFRIRYSSNNSNFDSDNGFIILEGNLNQDWIKVKDLDNNAISYVRTKDINFIGELERGV